MVQLKYRDLYPAVIGLAALLLSVLACSGGKTEAAQTEKRGELTTEYYAPQSGIGHGDGTPGGCTFTFKGQKYATLPMVKNAGKMFRCDVKPDSDEPVVRIAFYRPEDDWTCGTRFGAQKAKCLPDNYEAAGGILTVRNGELTFEDHGFWDVSYDWGEHSVKFKDGREFDYKNWKWTGCGDDPLKFVKSGSLVVASGQFCNSEDWQRIYFSGKELLADGAGTHPFDSVGINQDSSVPSATVWTGFVKGFVYLSQGRPVFKEVPESPEIIDDGTAAQWWSEDYQTRYKMMFASEIVTQQTRDEVHAVLETTTAEKERLKQDRPLLNSDEFGKFEVDYKDKHSQFHLGDLKRYDELTDIGAYPYRATGLLTTARATERYYVFALRSVTETAKIDDPCLGTFTTSLIWVQANEDLLPRNASSQVISSCKLGRKPTGEIKVADGKISALFEENGKKFDAIYNNIEPDKGIIVTKIN